MGEKKIVEEGIQFLTRLERIFLYQDAGGEPINYPKLKSWLERCFRQKNLVALRQDLFSFYLSSLSPKSRAKKLKELASQLARIRVRNPEQRSFPEKALPMEIDYEMRNLRRPEMVGGSGALACHRKSGVIYDAYEFMKILSELIPKKDTGLPFLHIIITEQMVASFNPGDRYHLRSAFYGYPCLISTIGLVEAPARPREFYLKTAAGMPKELALREFGERVLHPKDPRMTEILKGQILQAIFYQITGNPHCENPSCLLFNAHWQEELLRAQIKGRLCSRHERILEEYLKV